jgi:hypothetical protein
MKAAKYFVRVGLGTAVPPLARLLRRWHACCLRSYDIEQEYEGCLKEWMDWQQRESLPLWTEKAY